MWDNTAETCAARTSCLILHMYGYYYLSIWVCLILTPWIAFKLFQYFVISHRRSTNSLLLIKWHIKAGRKWMTFCGYFEMKFLEIIFFVFWLKFHWSLFLRFQLNSLLVHIMAWHWIGNTPFITLTDDGLDFACHISGPQWVNDSNHGTTCISKFSIWMRLFPFYKNI